MAHNKKLVVDFNEKWVRSKSKEEFVEAHLHLGDKKFLEAEYNKIVKPEKEVKK